MKVDDNFRSCSTDCTKDELEFYAFSRMKRNSFFMKVLLCSLILAVVLMQAQIKMVLKQFGKKYIMSKNYSVNTSVVIKSPEENNTQSTENQTKPCLIIFWSTYFGHIKQDEEKSWTTDECSSNN